MQLSIVPSNGSAERPRRFFASRRWLVALLLAATIWGLVDVRRRGYPYPQTPLEHKSDLTVYTEAGWAFFDGRQPYEVANPRGWTYLYPPMFALVMAPLHVLPMQDQVTVWFFISLLICWGCYRECRRILQIVSRSDEKLAAACARWFPWLGVAAVTAALLPTLNCLQRGQVGIVKLYLLLLGVRLVLGGRSYRAWCTGGVVLAMPVVMKIIPLLPVGFLLFLQAVDFARNRWGRGRGDCPDFCGHRPGTIGRWSAVVDKNGTVPFSDGTVRFATKIETGPAPAGRRMAATVLGVCCGLVLFFLLVPAALIGWNANLRHLDTWARFMLTKADDGGMDPRSGNSHSARNQSLQNAAYRLGNFSAYALAVAPMIGWSKSSTPPRWSWTGPRSNGRCCWRGPPWRWPC